MLKRQASTRRAPSAGAGRLLSLLLLLPLLALGNCNSQDGFECGAPQRNNTDVIGRCGRNLEVCMCATLSCAVQDRGQFRGPAPEDDAEDPEPMPAMGAAGAERGGAGGSEPGPPAPAGSNICKSGYRYTDAPFANSTWANRCVPLVHLQTAIVGTQENPGPMCPTVPPKPPVGGASGSGGSGGMSGTAGAGAESGGGAGGVGGQSGGAGGDSPSPIGGMSGEPAVGGNKSEGGAAGVPANASGAGGT